MQPSDPVRARLLKAALDCFLSDDYHDVSTRMIAEKAGANVSMIRYYFGSKEGLYKEMIRDTLNPVLNAFDSQDPASPASLTDVLRLYYATMSKHPAFPKLILKVIALNHGPGKRFIQQLLERTRTRAIKRMDLLKTREAASFPPVPGRGSGREQEVMIDPQIFRMTFVSLAMTPMLLKELFEEQLERELDAEFLNTLAEFNGRLLSAALATPSSEQREAS